MTASCQVCMSHERTDALVRTSSAKRFSEAYGKTWPGAHSAGSKAVRNSLPRDINGAYLHRKPSAGP